ncbi:MAG: hypothetical protein HRT58_12845 [Crocinitomicaceae bacterium]|nr:hypothetical protein [Flavobacteriales bacterium]NQZ36552.1 hypothetical protein [Crocinitomicaceae bacterium]
MKQIHLIVFSIFSLIYTSCNAGSDDSKNNDSVSDTLWVLQNDSTVFESTMFRSPCSKE